MSDQLVKDPSDIVKVGQDVKVKILSISSTERHLGLSLKAVGTKDKVKREKKMSKKELEKAVDVAIEEELPKE
jgi:ribosomal protein S1